MDRNERDVLSRKILPGTPGGAIGDHNDFVELVFEDAVPLGIHVISHGNRLLKVSEFLQGSQAETVCIGAEMDPLKFVGALIVGINGKEQNSQDKGEFYKQLKDPSRPKTIMFELRAANSHVSHGRSIATEEDESLVELVFRQNRALGIMINKKTLGNGFLRVSCFPEESQAEAVANELSKDPRDFMGANIVAVNGRRYEDTEDLYEAIKTPARPKAVLFKLDLSKPKMPPRNEDSRNVVFDSDSMRQLSSSIEEMEKMNDEVMVSQERNGTENNQVPRRLSRRELLQKKAVFATESMRQLSLSIEEMDRMNEEVMVNRERSNSQSSSRSGAILGSIKSRLSRKNSTDSESSPASRPRTVLQGLKNLSIGIRNRSKSDSVDSDSDHSDRVLFGVAIETQPRQPSFISRCEDKSPVADRIEFQSLNDSKRFRLLREEAKEACLKAIQDHHEVFVGENPTVSYEEWIEELHPENAKSMRNLVRGKSIDHRFYVEDSDHRELWNANLGDGEREFVPTREYSPVKGEDQVAKKKEKTFSRSPPQMDRKAESPIEAMG